MPTWTLRQILFSDELIHLRQRILHPDGPKERVLYRTDQHPLAIHLGVFSKGGELLACGSLLPEDEELAESSKVDRIRGMAVDDKYQGEGHGRRILKRMIAISAERQIQRSWCNARTTVIPFYEKVGFKKTGIELDVPDSGLHFQMRRVHKDVL